MAYSERWKSELIRIKKHFHQNAFSCRRLSLQWHVLEQCFRELFFWTPHTFKCLCRSYPAGIKPDSQHFKCERADAQRVLVVSLAVKESEAPAGEAHLFTPEPMTLCVYVCVHVSQSTRMFMCEDRAPTGAKTQK